MKKPFFSIIIPTYNSADTLSDAIISVSKQTFTDFEIWVIDGKSTDSTIEIIQSFQKTAENIYYLSEPDKGVYDAMNKGIKRARGKWLYFLGSDDKLHDKTVLLNVYNHILNHPKSKLVYGDVKITGDAGWAGNNHLYDGEFTYEKLIQKNISHQACFYHKSLFKKHGTFNLKYKVCADYDFNLKTFLTANPSYTPVIVACFFAGGISTVINDQEFSTDKWRLIVKYANIKIMTKPFIKYRNNILQQRFYFLQNHFFLYYFLILLFYLKQKVVR